MNAYGYHDSTNQCVQYKLNIVYKTWQQKHSVFILKIYILFLSFHGVVLVKTFPLLYQLLL